MLACDTVPFLSNHGNCYADSILSSTLLFAVLANGGHCNGHHIFQHPQLSRVLPMPISAKNSGSPLRNPNRSYIFLLHDSVY